MYKMKKKKQIGNTKFVQKNLKNLKEKNEKNYKNKQRQEK